MLALLNIGPFELLVLGAAAVMMFGGDLPDVARKAARMVNKFRALSNELTRELHTPPELKRPSELDLGRSARDIFGKLGEPPRPPFEATPDNPIDVEAQPAKGVVPLAATGDAADSGTALGDSTASDTAAEDTALDVVADGDTAASGTSAAGSGLGDAAADNTAPRGTSEAAGADGIEDTEGQRPAAAPDADEPGDALPRR